MSSVSPERMVKREGEELPTSIKPEKKLLFFNLYTMKRRSCFPTFELCPASESLPRSEPVTARAACPSFDRKHRVALVKTLNINPCSNDSQTSQKKSVQIYILRVYVSYKGLYRNLPIYLGYWPIVLKKDSFFVGKENNDRNLGVNPCIVTLTVTVQTEEVEIEGKLARLSRRP